MESVTYLRHLLCRWYPTVDRYDTCQPFDLLNPPYFLIIAREHPSALKEPLCPIVADATTAGKAHCVISAFDTQAASTVAAKSPGSALATKAGAGYSATKISTIARIISRA